MKAEHGVDVVLVVAEPWNFESPFGRNVVRYRCWPTTLEGERALVGSSDREISWGGKSYQHMLFAGRDDGDLLVLPIVRPVGVNAYALPRMTLDRQELLTRAHSTGPGVIGHLERPPQRPPSPAAVVLHHFRWAMAKVRRVCGAFRGKRTKRGV